MNTKRDRERVRERKMRKTRERECVRVLVRKRGEVRERECVREKNLFNTASLILYLF